jgi:pilus assembly protein CpaE
MARDVKFIILNGDENFGVEARETLLNIDGVKIVAEVDEPALLGQAVAQFPIDIVLANLDPAPESVLPIVGDVAAANPNVAVFASSQSTDGQLILKVMRLGIKEFFPVPLDGASLAEAVGKIAEGRVTTNSNGKLFTVMGAAGGVGSTMLTANLAIELSMLGNNGVTLVDLDYRYGQVATLLDVDPSHTLADLANSPEELEPTVLTKALAAHASGVKILARPNNFEEADNITAAACMGVFSTLLEMNDYVVADGPTRFDVGGKSLLALSDCNLLIVQTLVPCVRNAMRIIDWMRQSGQNLDRTKVICNRVGRESAHLTVKNVSETLGLPVVATIPEDWSTVSSAINLGEPLSDHSPKSKVRTAIQEIAQSLHEPGGSDGEDSGSKKGLIGRIFAQG